MLTVVEKDKNPDTKIIKPNKSCTYGTINLKHF